jgi:glycosyltransferase involved in cell wall biosynthesis
VRLLVVCGAGVVYGRELVTLSLIEGLRSRGHEVQCLTTTWGDGKFAKLLEKSSVPYTCLPLGFISKTVSWPAIRMTLDQIRKLPALWHGFRKLIKAFRPDIIVHSNFHHIFVLWPLLKAETNVFHVHDNFPATPFYRRLFKILNRRITAFVGVSKFVANTLMNLGVPENKVFHVLNGVSFDDSDYRTGSNGDDSLSKHNGAIRIGIVGQVDEWKGHEDLIDALHILDQKQEPFICRIFGAGSDEFAAKLKNKIAEYELTNNIEWMGFIANRRSIYDNLDVCVVPSRMSEAFGMVAAEALMYGVPVVASRIGALPEVVLHGDRTYLVDSQSPEQIADQLVLLSGFSTNRSEKTRRATNAQTLAALSTKRMVDEMEEFLNQLVVGNTHSPGK